MPGPDKTIGVPTGESTPKMPTMSVNEKALAFAMLHNRPDSIVRYTVDSKDGNRILEAITDTDWPRLVRLFKSDPKDAIATARLNIFSIRKDLRFPENERKSRIERYVRAFLDLQIKLDIAAFPNSETPQLGVPEYIPHGMIDMGSDNTIDPARREREMLHVDKREMFVQTRQAFIDYFNSDIEDSSTDQAKLATIKGIAITIFKKMPYDLKEAATFNTARKVVGMHDVFNEKLAVCRHHALYTQVMLQACGITSRLFKCDVDFEAPMGAHAANLVRVNGKWYVLDTTNPDRKGNVGEVFMFPLTETEMTFKTMAGKEWSTVRNNGVVFKYRPRDNMYSIIRHE
jgi:hypothetical protein